MNSALSVAKSGLDAQQIRLSVISNNLANANTMGFKSSRAVFADLLYQNIRQVGAQSSETTQLPSGLMIGTGVRAVATEMNHSQGNLIQTEGFLDLAVQGRGFFQILLPDGSLAYTRDGSFQLNSTGEIVTASGDPLQPAITIPSDAQSVTIGSDGVVSITIAGDTASTQVGNIQLADFPNPTGLQPLGDNQLAETTSSGAPQTGTPGLNSIGSLVQGALESSNVNSVKELVALIETQRAYEMNSKAISTADEMLQKLNNSL
jgi:flagellar basal-body rod protein FlgG